MQIGDSALRVGGGGEDRLSVVPKHCKPGLHVAGVIRARLELRHDAEIGAQEAASELGDIS